MAFSLIIQESEYMEWIESIHALTLSFITHPSVPMNILQNFLEFWTYFAYYADKGEKPEFMKFKKMMLDISVTYINSHIELVNNSEKSFLEDIFENDVNIFEYMKFLAQLSQPK